MFMMPSCKEVSWLLSDERDRRLGFMERLGLRLHLAMCAACARVPGQLRLLGKGAEELPTLGEPPASERK